MNKELQCLADRLITAKRPEDIFGEMYGGYDEMAATLKHMYHQLAKVAHPDVYHTAEDRALAEHAFRRLTALWNIADVQIRDGIAIESKVHTGHQPILLRTKTREYRLSGDYWTGRIYNHYPCIFEEKGRTIQATLRMVRDPQDNDLGENEARAMRLLRDGKEAPKFCAYFPALIDSFLYMEDGTARQANVFKQQEGWYSLEQVRRAYPKGIDPKDMAWMWRRLLVALGYTHRSGVVHGAVLPANIWILPGLHGLRLDEWSFSAHDPEKSGETIAAIDPAYEDWYPVEIQAHESPLPGADIGMAACCMVYLLGGDPVNQTLPATTPVPIKNFLKGCALPGKKARPQDAWALKDEFDALLERLWGERKFHPFTM